MRQDILTVLDSFHKLCDRESDNFSTLANAPDLGPTATMARLQLALEFNTWAIIFRDAANALRNS